MHDQSTRSSTPWAQNATSNVYSPLPEESEVILPAQKIEDTPTLPGEPAERLAAVRKGLRRRLKGKSLIGLAAGGGAAVVGALSLGELLSHPGVTLNPLALTNSGASVAQIGHLLRRAGFGATPGELNTYGYLGFEGAVDKLLNYQQVDDSEMEQRLKELNFDLENSSEDQQRWWLLRMAWTRRPLLEKMTLFWHGVLTSSFRSVGDVSSRIMTQNNFLRTHAFDTFDNILLGITADPAMLLYLNLNDSTKYHPNENYARELMELFTLGLGNYSQQDVFEASAALTGWHVNDTGSFYNAFDHSDRTIRFLGKKGKFTYKDIIHILTNHPRAPWFIGKRLFTFFVYENPTADDLKPLVDAYVTSKHNMGAVMRALLLSPQFSSPKAYRARIKSPVEFVVGVYHSLGLQGDGMGLHDVITRMGQTIFDPPNVAGWPGDKVSSIWLSSGAWMTRLNYLDALMTSSNASGEGYVPLVNLQKLISTNKLSTPEKFVDFFSMFLLDGPLPNDRRKQVIDYFKSSSNAGYQRITLSGGKSYQLNRVRGALYLLLAMPEYQLN